MAVTPTKTNNKKVAGLNGSATEKETEKMATSTATKEASFKVTSTPPAFRTRGREKSELRVQLEGLDVNEWLDAGEVPNDETAAKKFNSRVTSTANSVRQSARAEGQIVKFSIREGEDGHLWVGRLV